MLLEHGTLIEPDAVEFIMSRRDPIKFIKDFMKSRSETPLILSLEDVRTAESGLGYQANLKEEEPIIEAPEEITPLKPCKQSQVIDQIATLEPIQMQGEKGTKDGILVIMDITGKSTCDGTIENFTRHFRDRYTVLRRLVKARVEMGGPIKIQDAKRMERDVKVIGIVNEVGITKNGHISMTIEDDTGTMFALIPKSSELHSETILRDEVIGLIGKVKGPSSNATSKGRGSHMLIPEEIYRPDIPINHMARASSEDIEVAFLSDVHVGSKYFLPESWNMFVDWIKSEEASRIRYVLVAGDLVDGIGIYPNQEDELDIPNIVDQYAELAKMVSVFPSRMKVILQPGNHDSVRPAEPQPALSEKLRKGFSENAMFIGNPCYLGISGVEILAYHGRSIDDLVGAIPGLTYQNPIWAMQEMLKRRHLAISYGGKTPLAPEMKDYMVINPVPDIFVTGHVHRTNVERYRGITLINASAWQSQTPFQLMHNFHPDPAKAVIVNLKSGAYTVKDFNKK